jgi:FKBP-type peptidyl-prolyl cis-trans isomerase FkpA
MLRAPHPLSPEVSVRHGSIARRVPAASIVAALLVFAGCRRDDAPEPPPPPPDFAAELGVDLSAMERSDSWLYVRTLQAGEGEGAVEGAKIRVTYTGWLPDGTQFDSNVGQDPLLVTLGKDFLIDGFMEGIDGIKIGEERLLVVPPTLAYGTAGEPGVIPRNSWLVFKVRRVDEAGVA